MLLEATMNRHKCVTGMTKKKKNKYVFLIIFYDYATSAGVFKTVDVSLQLTGEYLDIPFYK